MSIYLRHGIILQKKIKRNQSNLNGIRWALIKDKPRTVRTRVEMF
jgi:hypothetical protein